MKDAGIDAVYVGGYHTEGGLILRQMREQGMKAQMISGDAFNTEEFWTITGDAGEGMIFTFAPEPRNNPAAKDVVEEFKAAGYDPEGYTLYEYAAIQAWAQAAAATSGTDGKKIAEWLRAGNTFKTVLGDLSLNEKGDIKDAKYVWYKFSQRQVHRRSFAAISRDTSDGNPRDLRHAGFLLRNAQVLAIVAGLPLPHQGREPTS